MAHASPTHPEHILLSKKASGIMSSKGNGKHPPKLVVHPPTTKSRQRPSRRTAGATGIHVHAAASSCTSGTMRFIMKHTLIAISHSAIMSSEGLIIALLGTISFRTRFQEIISRKPHIRRCLQSIETLTRHPPSNMRMSKHHSNREILEI